MKPYDHVRRLLDADRTVVLSGPMGSELVRRGVRWRGHGMLTDADTVRSLYAEYLDAGADVLRTNTFQLNRRIYLDVFRDEAHMAHIGAPGLATRHVDLTRRAVELARGARDASGRPKVAIAGVMSPLEHCFRPDLTPDAETARREHTELAGVLADAGADLVLIESMNMLGEAEVALNAASGTGLPVWVGFVLGPEGALLGGDDLAQAARRVRELGAQAVLVGNVPPDDVVPALRALTGNGATDSPPTAAGSNASVPLGAIPHLGKYDPPSWKFEFFPRFAETDAWPPERLAALAEAWRSLGARIVGSDSGSRPDHTRALIAAREAVA
ncbi:MAG: homocysteine S-methyltransferase family protein [Chloroflexota bacterium]|nr:homocysteine S-methyltransferase family protein [Chloroflexota bacterium]